MQKIKKKGFSSKFNKTKCKIQFFLVHLLVLLALDNWLCFYSIIRALSLIINLALLRKVKLLFKCLRFEPRAQINSLISDQKS